MVNKLKDNFFNLGFISILGGLLISICLIPVSLSWFQLEQGGKKKDAIYCSFFKLQHLLMFHLFEFYKFTLLKNSTELWFSVSQTIIYLYSKVIVFIIFIIALLTFHYLDEIEY